MSSRIKEMRHALRTNLEQLGTPGTWEHVTKVKRITSFIKHLTFLANWNVLIHWVKS